MKRILPKHINKSLKKGIKGKPEGHKREAKDLHDSNDHHVEESNPNKSRAKVDVYHNSHLLEKQQSSRQGNGNGN
jgi:hypothetical protein